MNENHKKNEKINGIIKIRVMEKTEQKKGRRE
jgi:hypothetical protein